jgi:hypothetical protein
VYVKLLSCVEDPEFDYGLEVRVSWLVSVRFEALTAKSVKMSVV